MHNSACRINSVPPWGVLGVWDYRLCRRTPFIRSVISRCSCRGHARVVARGQSGVRRAGPGSVRVRRRHWADGHGRAAFDPKMMVVLLGTARASGPAWVIEKRCARDVGYRVITSELHPDHAAIARFGLGTKRRWTGCSARCAVARGCRRNGSARHAQPGWHQASRQSRARANRTLPPIETAIAEAAEKDAAGRRSARRQTRSR